MLLDRVFPPDIRVEKEARTLIKAGHEVFLLSYKKERMRDEELVYSISVIRVNRPQGLKRYQNAIWFRGLFVYPFWKQILMDIIAKREIEALHVHDLHLVKTGIAAAKKFSIPIIADLHENMPEAVSAYGLGWKAKLINQVERWKRLEKYCAQNVHRIITVVEEAKEHYVNDCRVSPEKVTVVMNTEDLDYFYSLPIKENIVKKYEPYFIISYIGGFGHHRGIQTAISAMPKILRAIRNARLLLVGSGPNEEELRELVVKKEKVEDVVDFTGWQPFDLVPSYIATSQVCLIPHIASGHTNTTIPHKIFQYMAMGKPVVVSSTKPLERIVKEIGAGLVYPSGDANTLAEAVIKIYQDNSLAIELGEAGRRGVKEKYNWAAESMKLERLYRGLKN